MKQCKECKVVKEKNDFYGLQGECKQCTKKRVKLREQEKRKDSEWLIQEQKRHREKYHRLNYKEKYRPSSEDKKQTMKKYKEKYPEKLIAQNISQRMSRETKGNHLHHWNYNIEFVKDVIELSVKDHFKIHRFIKYDSKNFIYLDINGNPLDTKEKHILFINKILDL